MADSRRVPKPSRVSLGNGDDDDRQPGTSTLPVARVGKIIKADADIQACSKEAVFLIGVATEFFVKRFADQAYLKARLDSRKLVQLKDLAQAVSTTPEFTFLEDITPLPLPLSAALLARAEKETADTLPPSEAELDLIRSADVPNLAHPEADGREGAMMAKPKNKAGSSGKPRASRAKGAKAGGADGEDGSGDDEEETGEKIPAPRPAGSIRSSRRSGPPPTDDSAVPTSASLLSDVPAVEPEAAGAEGDDSMQVDA